MKYIIVFLFMSVTSAFGLNLDCDKVQVSLSNQESGAVFMTAEFLNGKKVSGFAVETVEFANKHYFKLENVVVLKNQDVYTLPLHGLTCK